MKFQQNVVLAPYTTLGIGGPAHWFARADDEPDVLEAHKVANEDGHDLFVLGGGSNLLIADTGFRGLVLQIKIQGIALEEMEGKTLLQAGAGESWDDLVQFAVDHDLQGMECLAGIPGTVGGTPVQNVGAYGQEVAQSITSLRALDRTTGFFTELTSEQCGFAYRTSLLNTTERSRYIVTRVDFALKLGGAPTLTYPDLMKRFSTNQKPTLREVAQAVREIRRAKSMVIDPADPNTRSAGSFFRNPIVARDLLLHVSEAAGVPLSNIPHWPAGADLIKLPAAWLLERAGFTRGYTMGHAGISTRHTLALINRGEACAADIAALREHIIAAVQQRFSITLEQEPVNVG